MCKDYYTIMGGPNEHHMGIMGGCVDRFGQRNPVDTSEETAFFPQILSENENN